MKNLSLAILCFLFIAFNVNSQNKDQYRTLLKEAWKLYESKEYSKSGNKYKKAFALLPKAKKLTENQVNARYNAACSFALAEKNDASFEMLFEIVDKGAYTNINQLTKDTDFKSLHEDSRWEKLTNLVKKNEVELRPLNKKELTIAFEKFKEASKNVFRTGSTVADVDKLYSLYTSDYEYNHPGYGGIYSRELLYNNTVKFLKMGRYNDSKKKETIKLIFGKNGVVEEWKYTDKSETRMTLYKFRKDKICYVEEFW